MNGRKPRVLVAMSGGVDSSLAAVLLKEDGWSVHGIHFLLAPSPALWSEKMSEARRAAAAIGIRLHVRDLTDAFASRVIDPFIKAYMAGHTPNPCVACNEHIKFNFLRQIADEMDISHIATGHYVQVRNENGRRLLLRGRDRKKDQSYFLHRLNGSHLADTLFPLGSITKEETRRLASEKGLPASVGRDSQEICFLTNQDYRLFLQEREGSRISRPGDIRDKQGRKVGTHEGTYRYTLGQRQGLGIASSRPYYVLDLKPSENIVIVGRKEDLYSSRAEAVDFCLTGDGPPISSGPFTAQVRYRHEAAPGRLEIRSRDHIVYSFNEPQWAVTPGQALVCYRGDQVIGGGRIFREGPS